MQSLVRLLVSAVFVVSLYAEQPQPSPPGQPRQESATVARPKPKRLRWLRRICSAEVGLAMKVSSIGIQQPTASAIAAEGW